MEIRFQNVGKEYRSASGVAHAVQNLDLTIRSGALHFLLGPSGCGKTTTLRMLAGLESPTSGKIFFDGKDVTKLSAAERAIGMVFQNYALWPHMTVAENIEYGLKIKKIPAAELKERVDEVLEATHLGAFTERLPGQLSGGQQQRVALARALAIRPNVLLLDEPLSNLDAKLRLEMRENITRIHKQTKITTVYVTHDQKESLSMGTSISVMRAGRLIQTGSPHGVYQTPETPFIAGFIGETNLIPGRVKGRDGAVFLVATDIGQLRVGRSMKEFSIDAPVMVSLRPEALQIEFSERTSQSGTHLQLPLEHLVYLGEIEQFQFRSQGRSLRASVFNPPEHAFKEGSSVPLFVADHAALLLSPEEDLQSGT